jgi:DNA adenine methylase
MTDLPTSQPPPTFLKWAGGKARLAPHILARAPAHFRAYHEPFAGAAAVFFAFHAAGRITTGRLTDANPDLIECFTVVRDRPDDLSHRPRALEAAYLPRQPRRPRLPLLHHPRQRPCDPSAAPPASSSSTAPATTASTASTAAPVQRPPRPLRPPRIADVFTLRAASVALQGIDLHPGDFADACASPSPATSSTSTPYHPLSRTAHFTAYTQVPLSLTPRSNSRLHNAF